MLPAHNPDRVLVVSLGRLDSLTSCKRSVEAPIQKGACGSWAMILKSWSGACKVHMQTSNQFCYL